MTTTVTEDLRPTAPDLDTRAEILQDLAQSFCIATTGEKRRVLTLAADLSWLAEVDSTRRDGAAHDQLERLAKAVSLRRDAIDHAATLRAVWALVHPRGWRPCDSCVAEVADSFAPVSVVARGITREGFPGATCPDHHAATVAGAA